MSTINYTIRKARLNEAGLLTAIAMRSKAHWGYSDEWRQQWKEALTVTPEIIASSICFVAELDKNIKGFWCRSVEQTAAPSPGFLFVDPSAIGTGCGKQLWQAIKPALISRGIHSFTIEADPNAVSFYMKLGAKKIKEIDSKAIPDRKIPILRFNLVDE